MFTIRAIPTALFSSRDGPGAHGRPLIRWIFLGICACYGWGLMGETPGSSSLSRPAPMLRLSQAVYDMGRITGGTRGQALLVVTNTAARPVRLNEVRASCSCLSLGTWPTNLPAGASVSIPLEFRTDNDQGEVVESVTLQSDDPHFPKTTAAVVAFVWRPIVVDPPGAGFYLVPGEAEATVRLINQLDQPLILKQITTSRTSLVVAATTRIPEREYELRVQAVQPWGLGNIFGSVTVTTSLTNQPTLEFPVTALIPGDIYVTPSFFQLPATPLSAAVTRSVTIHSLWTNALELASARLEGPGVELQVRPGAKPGNFELKAEFPAGFTLPPGKRLSAVVESNHPRFRRIEVPVIAAKARPQ